MKITRLSSIAALGAVAALTLAGCASNEAPAGNDGGTAPSASGEPTTTVSGTIEATGASSQGSAQEAWVAEFQTANPEANVLYESTGSGVGRDNFKAGASNFIGSDRAFKIEEIEEGGFGSCATDEIVEVPNYISPVAVAFNLPGVDSLNMDADTIAKIFAGEITSWDDPAIAALNEGVELPATTITPVHRSDASGTQETFQSYLAATAPDVWTWEPEDTWPLQSGEGADGTSGVVDAIAAGEGYIGFADASRTSELGQVAVQNGDEFISYSADAAAALVEASPLEEGRSDHDLAFAVDPAAAPAGSYPIALVSYLIGCVEYEDPEVASLVKAYFQFVTSEEGQAIGAEAAGAAPLSTGLIEKAAAAIDAIVTE
ncbi:phosphate ABC transporter substrate-binding protein PstS [Microbacterium paludicola]|uniref:Phosphate-binding protein n=1 Tax=Microbacterium paludicola TaxID=300019 RepID=A0A4Y9G0N8_9MICO|nr:phosphate ABC transporter substrate-binding protein PstS [Microbacterium paludicola]MBF0815033.1 phosphate ABC transporter substrate-binding protein PstS [Microbacterium paludicola]TFU34311.1 phosphate ABC transporter substrate-binding protein PstS [Microbacterium paludicola]